ncbi:hypothetical protein H312_02410 [Anncaliia algerae PRA339]|uniref:Uncharacterized protein n=1 Tax=Anncaliia algerae PRA339 TaxID=1288291 RepID=A0A059EZM1_9MICR|nr:hypothetical protein H312_02410 [Anncaliia algerae PRA339]
MDYKLFKKELACRYCKFLCGLESIKSQQMIMLALPKYACKKYKAYYNIRKKSIFEGFGCDRDILKILIKYLSMQPRYSIKSSVNVSTSLVVKILNKCIVLMSSIEISANKLGGPLNIVQIDEMTEL